MDWVDRPKNYKCLYGILQLLQGSHLDNFPHKTLKLSRFIAFYSLTLFNVINIRNSPQCPHVSAMGYHRSPSSSPAPPLPSTCHKPCHNHFPRFSIPARLLNSPPSHARCVTVRVCQRLQRWLFDFWNRWNRDWRSSDEWRKLASDCGKQTIQRCCVLR